MLSVIERFFTAIAIRALDDFDELISLGEIVKDEVVALSDGSKERYFTPNTDRAKELLIFLDEDFQYCIGFLCERYSLPEMRWWDWNKPRVKKEIIEMLGGKECQ